MIPTGQRVLVVPVKQFVMAETIREQQVNEPERLDESGTQHQHT
jgi:hypothetical protein